MTEAVATLASLVAPLESDGYTALIEASPDVVTVTITAGSDACANCLAPHTVIQHVLADALRQARCQARLELIYPGVSIEGNPPAVGAMS